MSLIFSENYWFKMILSELKSVSSGAMICVGRPLSDDMGPSTCATFPFLMKNLYFINLLPCCNFMDTGSCLFLPLKTGLS